MPPDPYLTSVVDELRKLKALADKAITQVREKELFETLDEESNSIAILMKHMAGNMRSRWTDFLTSDGEKPDRQRDREFMAEDADTRETVLAAWEAGWRLLFDALAPLTRESLQQTVFIRAEPLSVVQAINRQFAHYAYHVGQIVFLAKHFAAGSWQSLSIARNRPAR